MLIIGETFEGEYLICICYEGKNFGKVYVIDDIHDDEFILISKSFDKFLNGFEYIKPEDEDDED